MATSVVLATRPDWTRSTLGIPIDTIVRIHPGTVSAKPDLAYSRNRVSVSRVPGATARPEDEYDVGYVYGPEATHQDIAARSLLPLLRKFVDGYNVAVLAFGATGTGKTRLLAGSEGKEQNSAEGSGLVHIAVDELFKLLTEKAVFLGNLLAEKRRTLSARAFDFFIESSFVELYREEVYDLYRKPQASRTPLQVYEDITEGYQVSGLTSRISKTAAELRTAFNTGRCMRDSTREDVGSVHDRTAAIFTIHLAQFSPSAGAGEEDRILVSKIQFVDLPGSERLAEDPEILRLREGPILNRALHALGANLRSLAEGPGGALAPAAAAAAAAASANAASRYGGHGLTPAAAAAAAVVSGGGARGTAGGGLPATAAGSGVPFVNYEASVLTKLLADALGGNSLCLMAGTVRQADGSGGLQALNTLQYLTIAGAVRNFPIINHGRSRGLVQKLRYRLMAVIEDRQALRDLLDTTPAEGDPNSMALHIAKLRDLEARLLAVRSENAELREEKQALQARLQKLHKAEEGELAEMQELQEALIQSEEQRLQLSRALIDFQMEYNEARMEWETVKYELETKLIEAEARKVEASDEQVEQLQRERDELATRVAELVRELEDAVNPRAVDSRPQTDDVRTGLDGAGSAAEGQLGAEEVEAVEASSQLGQQGTPDNGKATMKDKDRRIEELRTELAELQGELEAVRKGALGNQVAADEVRETYRRKLEAMMRHLAGLGLSVWEGEGQEGGGDPRVTPEALFRGLQGLANENVKVTEAREADMRQYADDAMARLVELRRKFKALYAAYREMRRLVEDRWPGPDPPPAVLSEESVVGGALEGLLRSEEEADRRTINKLRDQVSQLQGQLETMRMSRGLLELTRGGGGREQPADPRVSSAAPFVGPARDAGDGLVGRGSQQLYGPGGELAMPRRPASQAPPDASRTQGPPLVIPWQDADGAGGAAARPSLTSPWGPDADLNPDAEPARVVVIGPDGSPEPAYLAGGAGQGSPPDGEAVTRTAGGGGAEPGPRRLSTPMHGPASASAVRLVTEGPAQDQAAPSQRVLGAEGGAQLLAENQRLREELATMRKRLQTASELPTTLELENQRLRGEVDSLGRRLQTAQSEAAAAGSKAAPAFAPPPNNSVNEAVIRQLREFNQKKTSELQRRVQQSESRAVMAEEQLDQLQSYMNKASVAYQKEIVRLRSIIGQMEATLGAAKGSYLNLNPLEGVGGGGALKPAAVVLDEIATRGSLSRRSSGQGQTVITPRASRSGGGPRSPLGNVQVVVSSAVTAGTAAASAKADESVIQLPAL